jgi:hypothetical protein
MTTDRQALFSSSAVIDRNRRRAAIGWLIWCVNEGYLAAADRAILHNWLLDDESTLTADDLAEKNKLLGMADEILRVEPLSDRDNLRMILEHMEQYGGQLTLFCHTDAEGSDVNSRWGGGYHFGSEGEKENTRFPECPECGAPPGQAHDPICPANGDPGLAAGAAYGMAATPDLVLHQIADTLGVR